MNDTNLSLPPMSLEDMNKIIFNKMKSGKACDIYHLTVEHLRYCGNAVRSEHPECRDFYLPSSTDFTAFTR